MERQPHHQHQTQQVEVATIHPAPLQDWSLGRLAVVCFFMVWPWFLVSTGLFLIKDFRITIAMYEVFGCVLPFVLLRKSTVQLFPLVLPKRWILLFALLANICFLVCWKSLYPIAVDWAHSYERMQAIHLGSNNNFWGYGLYFVFFNPMFEEIFWRGVVYNAWKNYVSPWKANFISSIFFGAWHWVILQHFCTPLYAILLTGLVAFGGMIFAYTYERTGTLGASILMHGWGGDLPMMLFVYSAVMNSAGYFH